MREPTDDELRAFRNAFDGVPTAAPWNLADASTAGRQQVLVDLGRWVTWLSRRYHLSDTIPDCWARHGALVEELLALHVAWNDAYRRPDAPATAPLGWHDAFARTRERIRAWNRWGCAANLHRPEPAAAEPLPASRT
jgi:hypothetical protein